MLSGTPEPKKPTEPRPAATGGTFPRRAVLLAIAGAGLIGLSTGLPDLFFDLQFQRPLAKRAEAEGLGVLVEKATWVAPTAPAEWTFALIDGARMPLPPGEKHRQSREGETLLFDIDGARFAVDSMPPGSLTQVFQGELRAVGGVPSGESSGTSDGDVLRTVMEERVQNYRRGWSANHRNEYAARLLSKLLLFESGAVRRIECCERQSPSAVAALVEFESGETKCLVAREDGVWIVRIPRESPATWRSSPANWLPALND